MKTLLTQKTLAVALLHFEDDLLGHLNYIMELFSILSKEEFSEEQIKLIELMKTHICHMEQLLRDIFETISGERI